MYFVTDEHYQKVWDVIKRCFEKGNEHFGINLSLPELEFWTHKSTVAGKASTIKNKVMINTVLFLKNEQDYYENTIPHECAHIIADKAYNDFCGHDYRWKYVMTNVLGVGSKRTHKYNTTGMKRAVRKYLYTCACRGVTHRLSPKQHSLIWNQGRKYYCNKCGAKLVFTEQMIAPALMLEVVYQRKQQEAQQSGGSTNNNTAGVSKISRAREVFKANINQPRHVIVRKFVEEVGLTPAGANTYYYNLSKELIKC